MLGKHTLDWFWCRDNDIHIMVETHLDKQKHNTLCQYFEVRGRHAFGLPAHTSDTNEGNHGGILVLHANHHGVTQLENYHIEGCGFQAFLWEAKARSILVVAVYFKTNETIQGPTNSQLLGRLLALVEASNRQYILLGDWNGHPNQFQGTRFLDTAQHWDKRRDPRTMELMQHTSHHQLTQAQEQSRTETQLRYAAWIRQGEAKGLRGLFSNLKASELSWQRPYRHIPVADRMRHRLHDWTGTSYGNQLQTTSQWPDRPCTKKHRRTQPSFHHSLLDSLRVHSKSCQTVLVAQMPLRHSYSGMHHLTHFPACSSSSRTWKPPPPYPHNSR